MGLSERSVSQVLPLSFTGVCSMTEVCFRLKIQRDKMFDIKDLNLIRQMEFLNAKVVYFLSSRFLS